MAREEFESAIPAFAR